MTLDPAPAWAAVCGDAVGSPSKKPFASGAARGYRSLLPGWKATGSIRKRPMADLIDLREDKSYDKALSLAEKHLETAIKSSGDLADYLPVAMIEAAVNQSADLADPEELAEFLRELADNIIGDDKNGDDDTDDKDRDDR
jgi:hypothetical protein